MKREKNQREKLWDEATGHCVYCGKPVAREEMEVDHIVPLCRGGGKGYGNKVCSCPQCNAAKADRPLEEFLRVSMNEKQRKRFSNRINTLAEQGKMDWSKADLLDPYTTEGFDDDWDDELDGFDDAYPNSIWFSGKLALRFW